VITESTRTAPSLERQRSAAAMLMRDVWQMNGE
jgi:hypothetical protein